MPIAVALLAYLGRLFTRRLDIRLKLRQVGPALLVASAAFVPVLWLHEQPPGLAVLYAVGEIAGVLAVFLMSCALLLGTRARWLEAWFGGLDRMYLWHKWAAVAGTTALLPHWLLTGRGSAIDPADATALDRIGAALGVLSLLGLLALVAISLPQVNRILHIPYHRWLFLHRFTGLLVITGLVHGLILDRVIAASPLLWTAYLLIGGTGVLAYAYDELVMRRRAPEADYVIDRVGRPSDQILELELAPTGKKILPRGGQFVFLRIGGDDAWREHPFSIAGSTPDGDLRLTIRSLGAETVRMHARLTTGLPATVTGPYGRFDYTVGGEHQVWIAGGIGIAPFLSWLDMLEPEDSHRIDLFYSTPTEAHAIYLPDLEAAVRRLPSVLRLHAVFTSQQGHLDAPTITAAAEVDSSTHVFLCGPVGMIDGIKHGLHRLGVPRDHVHSEHFAFR